MFNKGIRHKIPEDGSNGYWYFLLEVGDVIHKGFIWNLERLGERIYTYHIIGRHHEDSRYGRDSSQ
jgi:hypothetical protein